jgi:uncharacterized membrane protein
MTPIRRWLTHLWLDSADTRRQLPDAALQRLEAAVRQSEARHLGELRVYVEASLSPGQLWRAQTPRERALELFSQLRVWDTERNNGVLIYLLMADHRIEVVADRGLSRRVSHGEWQALADRLSSALQADQAEAGLNEAICRVGEMLRRHFPAPTDAPSDNDNDNELPDAVLLI